MTKTGRLQTESDPFPPDSRDRRPRSASTTKGLLRGPSWIKRRFSSWPFVVRKRCSRGPSWINQIMILQRFSSWSFVALRGQKKVFPRPFVDRPNYDLAKVFFVVLRGPSWPFVDKKRCSRGPSWIDHIMTLRRFSSWPFVDKKKMFPWPLVDRPNYDLAKVFFVVLRGPSWTKRRCSSRPFVDKPNYDLANLSSDKRQQTLMPIGWYRDNSLIIDLGKGGQDAVSG